MTIFRISTNAVLGICLSGLLACGAQQAKDASLNSQKPSPEPEHTVGVQKQKNEDTREREQTVVRLLESTNPQGRVRHDQPVSPLPAIASADSAAGFMQPNALAKRRLALQMGTPRVYENRERYESFTTNGVQLVAQQPVSTFSVDVDTASYSNVRRMLNHGQWPQADAVRVEELLNYFNYEYPAVAQRSAPFGVYTEMGPSPWNENRQLLHVGINGWQPEQDKSLPPTNLVFLIDVSGSMQAPNKLGLLKSAMKLMVNQMRPQDTLSIAVYAGASGQVLEPTSGQQKQKILAALDSLRAGGSTNGEAGIQLAYQLARENYLAEGINRVILATDGDFNVGTTDVDALEKLVERKRNSGVELTVLGFGSGNYNDHLMQKIAQIGNGNAAYIDTLAEARKVLVDEIGATLHTIAKDVKVQIEFNPNVVEAYRLIGYETRHLNREDFNNDKVDAGEIGSGHTVTALYELSLVGGEGQWVDELRYTEPAAQIAKQGEIGHLKLRYKLPKAQHSQLISHLLHKRDIQSRIDNTSENYRFSAAVAWFATMLREQNQLDQESFEHLIGLAQQAQGSDENGYRREFVNLAKSAQALSVALGYDVSQPQRVAGYDLK